MLLDKYAIEVEPLARIAERIGVTPGFLSQCKNGVRPWPDHVALAIERETSGLVTVAELSAGLATLLASAGYVKDAAA